MTARAYVQYDFAFMGGVSIHLGMKMPDGRIAIIKPNEDVPGTVNLSPAGIHAPLDPGDSSYHQPTLRITEDLARALLDALAAHYGGTTDVLTLRKDYLDERARVDRMINHLIR